MTAHMNINNIDNQEDVKNLLVISCIFGDKFKKVYPSPLSTNCFFFTNNVDLKREIESKGWKFVLVDFPLSKCPITSSLQSKYIKFLIFLNDYPEFKKYKQILYFDHKVFIKKEDIQKLVSLSNENNNKYNIIIRKHEEKRYNIWSEVDEAKKQERYNKNMKGTIEFINDKLKKKEIVENVEICNTGLIFYNNYDEIAPLLNSIYDTCINLQQPECQIVWAIFSQKYADQIKLIDFHQEINPLWKEPFMNRNIFTTISTKETNPWITMFLVFICFLFIIAIVYLVIYLTNYNVTHMNAVYASYKTIKNKFVRLFTV